MGKTIKKKKKKKRMSNNICKFHKNCQHHVQIHVQHCFSKCVTCNCI